MLLLISGPAIAQETVREKTGSIPEQKSTSPTSSDASIQSTPAGPTVSGMILISKQPIELLAGPSPSASGIYGFPAGRRFRVVGQQSGFAQLQDVKSGATGWIDEAALGQSPNSHRTSVASEPKEDLRSLKETKAVAASKPRPASQTHKQTVVSVSSKIKHSHGSGTAEATSQTSSPVYPKRRGFFGLRRNSAQGILF